MVDRLADTAMEAFGRVDVIVNTVGGGAGTALYPAESYPDGEWNRIMDLNLRAVLLPTQAAAACDDRRQDAEAAYCTSPRSEASSGSTTGFSAYVAAKGALDALTRQQATEWAKHGDHRQRDRANVRRHRADGARCWPTRSSAPGSRPRIPLHRIAEHRRRRRRLAAAVHRGGIVRHRADPHAGRRPDRMPMTRLPSRARPRPHRACGRCPNPDTGGDAVRRIIDLSMPVHMDMLTFPRVPPPALTVYESHERLRRPHRRQQPTASTR